MPYSRAYDSRKTAAGSFPGLRSGTKGTPRETGQRRAEDEAARLDAGHDVEASGERLAHRLDRLAHEVGARPGTS